MKALLNSFQRENFYQRLFKTNDHILVALSGGSDSVCLLKLFTMVRSKQKLRITAAHVNHGLRKKSDLDEKFVKQLCREWDVPLIVKKINLKQIIKKKKISLEEAGRDARYTFFKKSAIKIHANCIATAHTADDQAETVFMRLLRGSGLKGIESIRSKRVLKSNLSLIRPLLRIKKKDLRAALKRTRIPFREDESNKETIFTRNRIRLRLLPRIQNEFSPNFDQHLISLSNEAALLYEYIQDEAARKLRRISTKKTGRIQLSLKSFKKLHPSLRAEILFQAIEWVKGDRRRMTRKHILSLQSLALGQDREMKALPNPLWAKSRNGKLTIALR